MEFYINQLKDTYLRTGDCAYDNSPEYTSLCPLAAAAIANLQANHSNPLRINQSCQRCPCLEQVKSIYTPATNLIDKNRLSFLDRFK